MFEIIFTAFVATLIVQTNDCAQAPACPKLIKTCERGKISFYLYKELSQPPEELILGDANSIKNAPFIPKANFKILIHGYTGSRDGSPAMVNLRREYLKVQNKFNILVVDWGPLAVDGCYFETAFPSVPLVGKCCTDLVNSILQNRPEITADQFHCIGWSMGAHICARFGVHFRPRIIPRITGLDPALPNFELPYTESDNILNKNHAKFVDVIHSNIDVLGVLVSNAHYDIYANNGTSQPGCDINDLISCSHRRSVEILAESINSKVKFIARKCENNAYYLKNRSCDDGDSIKHIEVGEYCKPPVNKGDIGTYYLQTNDHPPYAIPCGKTAP